MIRQTASRIFPAVAAVGLLAASGQAREMRPPDRTSLQAALAARSGATATSLLIAALAPAGRLFARRRAMRKVSIT